MRQFDVVVCKKKITVMELEKPLKTYHVSANVDGDNWLYRISKLPHHHLPTGWQERGYVQAYYHAKNNGSHVQFNRVDAPGKRPNKKRHTAQLRLFH